jgi:hypothetical protein
VESRKSHSVSQRVLHSSLKQILVQGVANNSYPLCRRLPTSVCRLSSVKNLGILITPNLCWSQHISNILLRARRLIGMLYRKFYKNAQPATLLQLYVSFICPHLEYCSAVWDPYLAKDTEHLEKTQKFELKVCMKSWSLGYDELLSDANVPSLAKRRSQARLCNMYKIMHKQSDFPHAPIESRVFHYNSRSDNTMAIKPIRCRTSQFLNSFFPRTASQWNSLPTSVVTQSKSSAFKHCVTKLSSYRIRYMFCFTL